MHYLLHSLVSSYRRMVLKGGNSCESKDFNSLMAEQLEPLTCPSLSGWGHMSLACIQNESPPSPIVLELGPLKVTPYQ